MNATFRSIDLLTNILAPIAVGQIMAYISSFASAVFICGWNVCSVTVEYGLLHIIFRDLPALANKVIPAVTEKPQSLYDHVAHYCDGWRKYFQHRIIWSGLAIASLYMTVLAFHSITIGYAYSQGVTEGMVGICMAIGSLVGIAGSSLFPYMVKCFGLQLTGLIGFSAELVALIPCVIALWLPGSPFELYTGVEEFNHSPLNITLLGSDSSIGNEEIFFTNYSKAESVNSTLGAENGNSIDGDDNVYTSIIAMMAGIIAARFGLWVADLCVTQIIQENTAEHERGVINGIQASLNMILETLKYTLVVIVPRIPQFGYLVIASFIFIFIGTTCFFIGWRRSLREERLSAGADAEAPPPAYDNEAYV